MRAIGSAVRVKSLILAISTSLAAAALVLTGPGAIPAKAAFYTTNLAFKLDTQDPSSYTNGSDTWNDVSGLSNNFTRVTGSKPIYSAGNGVPNSFLFTRATQTGAPPSGATFFSGGANSNTNFAAGSFTVAAWIRVPVGSYGNAADHWQLMHILSAEAGGGANDWGFGVNNIGRIAFGTGGASDATLASGTQVTTNTWTFVAATRTYATNAIAIYVNDGAATTGTLSGGAGRALTAISVLRLGAGDDGGVSFGGNIAAVFGYTAALTSAQILDTFNATKGAYGFSTPTTTSLAALNSSTTFGAIDTLTATVSQSAATGTVNFLLNGTSISGCSAVAVSSGVASCPYLPASTGTISNLTASYSGDSSYDASTSSAISITVTAGTPALSIAVTSVVPYRVNAAIVATSSPAGTDGKVSFTQNGKRIPGCLKLQSASLSTTCNWKPSVHALFTIGATLTPTSSNFNSVSALPKLVFVQARSTRR
jgi:hypothetical protein